MMKGTRANGFELSGQGYDHSVSIRPAIIFQ